MTEPISVHLEPHRGYGYVKYAEGPVARQVWMHEVARIDFLEDGTIAGVANYAVGIGGEGSDDEQTIAERAQSEIANYAKWPEGIA